MGSRIIWVRLAGLFCNLFVVGVYVPHRYRTDPCQADVMADVGNVLRSIPAKGDAVVIMGDFNAYNLCAAYATAIELGKDSLQILTTMSLLSPVEGRFQTILGKGITAIVDYAHTPDALQNVMSTINTINEGQGKVITVVGCGGNRDTGKRPQMATIAAQYSQTVILTSDNPRDEEPEDIIAEMVAGLSPDLQKRTVEIVDRKQAIKSALMMAEDGDIVLIAGKGHEKYQEIKGQRHDFDDVHEVTLILNT